MTNYKKIKGMSKKKLVEFLLDTCEGCAFCVYSNNKSCAGKKCEKGVKKWLEREAEE